MASSMKLMCSMILVTLIFRGDCTGENYLIPTFEGPTSTNPAFFFCPRECECPASHPFYCARCKDQSRNFLSRCQDCNPPKVLKGDQCVLPACPKNCACSGIIPWICTGCADKYADFGASCLYCLKNAIRNPITEQCEPSTPTCPEGCLCNGTVPGVPTSCVDRFKKLSSNCKDCLEGYSINKAGQCSPYRNACPDLCDCRGINPTICTHCHDPGRNLSMLCEVCKKDYFVSPSGLCTNICPPGCICNEQYCSRCISQYNNPNTFCSTCLLGATMDSSGKCTKGCDGSLCVCSLTGCSSCYDLRLDPSTGCQCPWDQVLSAGAQCLPK